MAVCLHLTTFRFLTIAAWACWSFLWCAWRSVVVNSILLNRWPKAFGCWAPSFDGWTGSAGWNSKMVPAYDPINKLAIFCLINLLYWTTSERSNHAFDLGYCLLLRFGRSIVVLRIISKPSTRLVLSTHLALNYQIARSIWCCWICVGTIAHLWSRTWTLTQRILLVLGWLIAWSLKRSWNHSPVFHCQLAGLRLKAWRCSSG